MRSSTQRSLSKSNRFNGLSTSRLQGYYLQEGMKSIKSKLGSHGKLNNSQGYKARNQNTFKSSQYVHNQTVNTGGISKSKIFVSDQFRTHNRSNSPKLNLSYKKPIKIKINKNIDYKSHLKDDTSLEEKDVMNEQYNQYEFQNQDPKIKTQIIERKSTNLSRGSISKYNFGTPKAIEARSPRKISLKSSRLRSRLNSSKSNIVKDNLIGLGSTKTIEKKIDEIDQVNKKSQLLPKYKILQEKIQNKPNKKQLNLKLKINQTSDPNTSQLRKTLKSPKTGIVNTLFSQNNNQVEQSPKKNSTENVSPMNKIDLKNPKFLTSGQKSESTRLTMEKSQIQNTIKWELGPGERWDKIESNLLFGQCIGEGSFARVYDGFDKILKQAVAIKVIKKKMFKTDKKRKLVQLEVDILSKMIHQNVVKFERLLEDHKRVINFIFQF